MKALIAVDGSSHSLDAVAQIGLLLSAERDHVTFYYSPPEVFASESVAANKKVLERSRAAVATAVFTEAQTRLPQAMRDRTDTVVGTQSAAHGIIVAAKHCSADLIVMGARGLGPLQQLLLGSVSRAVVHQSETPVFVARPRQKPEPAPLKVLLACAAANECQRRGSLLNQLTWPASAVAHTITVVPSILGSNDIPQWLEEQARQPEADALSRAWVEEHDAEIRAKRAEITASLKTLPAPFSNSTPSIVEGHPAKRILETAAREHADLIIMGTHRYGMLERLFVGSTCDAVLSHAACSLLIVPAEETP